MRVLQGGGRRDDGAGRQAARAVARGRLEPDAADRPAGLAGADRAGVRAAGRWRDHDLRELALAVPDQPAARAAGAGGRRTDRASTGRWRSQARSTSSVCCSRASDLAGSRSPPTCSPRRPRTGRSSVAIGVPARRCLIAAVVHLMRVPVAAGRSAPHAHPQLPLGADRLGLSLHRAERGTVPGAAAVRGGVPLECREGRLDRALHLRRQHRRQADDHLPLLAPRLQRRADRLDCRAWRCR